MLAQGSRMLQTRPSIQPQASFRSRTRHRIILLLGLLIFAICPLVSAQQESGSGANASTPGEAEGDHHSTASLQKATQNPVSDLISVPFQNNGAYDIGPFSRVQNVLLIQPVIPVHLTKDWNLINRIIQPIVWQPFPNLPTGGEFGFGDMNPTFFLSPAKPKKLIWGVGPTFVIPTATNTILGQGKLSVGPSLVLLVQPHPWTIGVLTNNVWSVAGSGSRPSVNQFLLQYFINYNLKKGWYIDIAPIITANWKATSGNVWTVPVGGGIGRIAKVGFQPMSFALEFYGNAVHPAGASPWGMRIQISLLFPKLTAKEKKGMMEKELEKMEKEQKR